MLTCHQCRKTFSRNDSLRRHQKNYCKVSRTKNSKNKVHKGVNDDMLMIIGMFHEQRRKWKKDFKKFKNEVRGIEPSEQHSDEEMQNSENENSDSSE